MSDTDASRGAQADSGDTAGADGPGSDIDDVWARETAPQSSYTTRQVGAGLVVFAVCALLAFGLPLALT